MLAVDRGSHNSRENIREVGIYLENIPAATSATSNKVNHDTKRDLFIVLASELCGLVSESFFWLYVCLFFFHHLSSLYVRTAESKVR